MISFGQISSELRSVIQITVFAVVIFQFYAFCAAGSASVKKRTTYDTVIVLILAVISVLMLAVLAECDFVYTGGEPVTGLTCAAADIPVVIPVAYIIISAAYASLVLCRVIAGRKNMITRSSVRESADTMPAGLCFSRPDGITYLVNRKMEYLSQAMFGRSLVSESEFWKDISYGELSEGAERITVADMSAIMLTDGSVWTFDRKIIKVGHRDVVQLTASDISELYHLAERLKNENSMLKGMNLRLQQYSEDVEELVRARERLAAKIRIHDAIGQDLMASRYLIFSGGSDGDADAVFEKWRRTIALLKNGSEGVESTGVMKYIADAAGSAGVELVVEGVMPEATHIQELIVAAGAEALTNAVRHADASRLAISIRKTGNMYRVDFANDSSTSGCSGNSKVCEGGGLSSLRRRIEEHGGLMSVTSGNEFILSIVIPSERSTVV